MVSLRRGGCLVRFAGGRAVSRGTAGVGGGIFADIRQAHRRATGLAIADPVLELDIFARPRHGAGESGARAWRWAGRGR